MITRDEFRARCNPKDLRITDVMLGQGRIAPGMLLVNQRRQRGAAKWSRLQCWLLLAAIGVAVMLLLAVNTK